jgi:hypothetical protein
MKKSISNKKEKNDGPRKQRMSSPRKTSNVPVKTVKVKSPKRNGKKVPIRLLKSRAKGKETICTPKEVQKPKVAVLNLSALHLLELQNQTVAQLRQSSSDHLQSSSRDTHSTEFHMRDISRKEFILACVQLQFYFGVFYTFLSFLGLFILSKKGFKPDTNRSSILPNNYVVKSVCMQGIEMITISLITGFTIRRQHKINVIIGTLLNCQRLLAALVRLIIYVRVRSNIVGVTLYSGAELLFYAVYINQIWSLNHSIVLFPRSIAWPFAAFKPIKRVSSIEPESIRLRKRPLHSLRSERNSHKLTVKSIGEPKTVRKSSKSVMRPPMAT